MNSNSCLTVKLAVTGLYLLPYTWSAKACKPGHIKKINTFWKIKDKGQPSKLTRTSFATFN